MTQSLYAAAGWEPASEAPPQPQVETVLVHKSVEPTIGDIVRGALWLAGI